MEIDRRRFLKLMMSSAVVPPLTGAGCTNIFSNLGGEKKYNVLFLAVDDLNDWGGFPATMAISPTPIRDCA